jgi:hypothetical protein
MSVNLHHVYIMATRLLIADIIDVQGEVKERKWCSKSCVHVDSSLNALYRR